MDFVCTPRPPSERFLLINILWARKLESGPVDVCVDNEAGGVCELRGPRKQRGPRWQSRDWAARFAYLLKMCLGSWFFAGK